jgi:hypothetical protein
MCIFLIYLLLGRSSPPITEKDPAEVFGLRHQVSKQIRKYIVVKTFVAATTSVLVGVTLGLLDVPLPAVFGLLTFCLKFIPNVGSWIAVLLPVPLLLLDETITLGRFLAAIFIPAGIHIVMGDIVETQLFGFALNMHPAFTLLSLMLWGFLWGIPGMILAVPISAVIKIICESIDHYFPKFLASAMEGRLSSRRPTLSSNTATAASAVLITEASTSGHNKNTPEEQHTPTTNLSNISEHSNNSERDKRENYREAVSPDSLGSGESLHSNATLLVHANDENADNKTNVSGAYHSHNHSSKKTQYGVGSMSINHAPKQSLTNSRSVELTYVHRHSPSLKFEGASMSPPHSLDQSRRNSTSSTHSNSQQTSLLSLPPLHMQSGTQSGT